ncbi:hypothetical protein CCP4SC76_8100002 [Gammaproteobacteria bacterium]
MFTISKISTHARELNKEQHSTRYSKIIETLRLSSQSGSNLPEFLDLSLYDKIIFSVYNK